MAEQKKKTNKETAPKAKKSKKMDSSKTVDKSAEVSNNKVETAEPKTTENTSKTKKGVEVKVKTIIRVLTIVLVLAIIWALRGEIVVATVNGRPIYRWELVRQLESQSGQQVLQTLITQELITQEGNKLGIKVSNEEIDEEIAQLTEQFQTQGITFEQALDAQGLSMEDVRKGIKLQLTINKVLSDDNSVSDEEAQDFIRSNGLVEEDAEIDPELLAQVKAQLAEQNVFTETQLWLDQIQENANIKYLLFPEPAPTLGL